MATLKRHLRSACQSPAVNPNRCKQFAWRLALRPVEIQDFHLMAGCDSSFGWNDSALTDAQTSSNACFDKARFPKPSRSCEIVSGKASIPTMRDQPDRKVKAVFIERATITRRAKRTRRVFVVGRRQDDGRAGRTVGHRRPFHCNRTLTEATRNLRAPHELSSVTRSDNTPPSPQSARPPAAGRGSPRANIEREPSPRAGLRPRNRAGGHPSVGEDSCGRFPR